MANRSYLCGTNTETIYPSFVEPSYDSSSQTIANDVWCVPLLWTALFRPADIVARTFDADGEKVYVEAPLTGKKDTLVNLGQALPYFNRLFADEGTLDEYARFLRQAIEAAPYEFVTIEMEEIAACYDDPKEFYDMFRAALSGIGGPPAPKMKETFIQLAQFRNLRRFPPADLLLDPRRMEAAPDDDAWNHCRVCGAGPQESGIGRPAPWEPSA